MSLCIFFRFDQFSGTKLPSKTAGEVISLVYSLMTACAPARASLVWSHLQCDVICWKLRSLLNAGRFDRHKFFLKIPNYIVMRGIYILELSMYYYKYSVNLLHACIFGCEHLWRSQRHLMSAWNLSALSLTL